jgi:DNA polymerase
VLKLYLSYAKLLNFYKIAGVNIALSKTPMNRFSPTKTKKSNRANIETPIKKAQQAAGQAQTLEELKCNLQKFNECQLKFTAKNTCFSDGTPGSALMLIGEAPGRYEDIQALPFVGLSGHLLNRMLSAIGLQREQVYIANTIPWRPPGNRIPTLMEIEVCRPFIHRQIELACPKILVALGGQAAKFLTGAKEGILRIRGKWYVYQTTTGLKIPVMPTLHPAYLLRTPSLKKLAWQDFLMVKMWLHHAGELNKKNT